MVHDGLIGKKKDIAKEDSYHTMDELYHHRTILFAVICSMVTEMHSSEIWSWKSIKHSDGTEEDGWFIAGIQTPYGQVTYHQKLEYWATFDCMIMDQAPEFDGHTSNDVLERLIKTFI